MQRLPRRQQLPRSHRHPLHPCCASVPSSPMLQVRSVLRLDGNPRAQLAKQTAAPQADLSKQDRLGNVEEAVISKYAAADDDDEEGGEEEA